MSADLSLHVSRPLQSFVISSLSPHFRCDLGVRSRFTRLGLNSTQAITIFYRQVELHQGLPFNVTVPSATTQRTFNATDEGRDLVVRLEIFE